MFRRRARDFSAPVEMTGGAGGAMSDPPGFFMIRRE